MNVAVIGLDLCYQCTEAIKHLKQRGVTVTALVASDLPASREFTTEHQCHLFADVEALQVGCPPIDGIIAANIVCDRPLLIPLLEQGIPTWFFKQIAQNRETTTLIFDAVRRSNTPIMGGSSRRFTPAFSAIERMAKQGDLGRIVIAHRYEPHDITPGDWQDRKETSGGYIVNFGIHCVESLCALLGTDFTDVYCTGGRYLFEDAASEDSCVITITFASGAIGIAEVFGAQAPFTATQPFFRVNGTRRSVEAFVDEGLVRQFRGLPLYDPSTYSFCSGMEQSSEAFYQMMKTHRQPIPLEELEAISDLLFLARQSFETGGSLKRYDLL